MRKPIAVYFPPHCLWTSNPVRLNHRFTATTTRLINAPVCGRDDGRIDHPSDLSFIANGYLCTPREYCPCNPILRRRARTTVSRCAAPSFSACSSPRSKQWSRGKGRIDQVAPGQPRTEPRLLQPIQFPQVSAALHKDILVLNLCLVTPRTTCLPSMHWAHQAH